MAVVLLCAAGDPWDTFRRTLSGRFYVPHFISDAAADLIFKLLQASCLPPVTADRASTVLC